jgi:TolB-like protein/DNA-binding winged helix-turn-helix (wHTH) protein/Tfp pilus assembly protein PilF
MEGECNRGTTKVNVQATHFRKFNLYFKLLEGRIPGLVPTRLSMKKQPMLVRFGPFELRSRTKELFKGKTKLRLRPQPFRILEILLEHPGEMVTREELRAQVWSAGTHVDFEHGLNAAIKELRGVLSDSASKPRYVETLPKLGYRMMAPVVTEEADAEKVSPEGYDPRTDEIRPSEMLVPGRGGWALARNLRRWPILVGVFGFLIIVVGGFAQWSRMKERQPRATGRLMLAVLPFDNLTGDTEQDYFSDGLTEEMISQLGSLDPQKLGVIARTSVMQYRKSQKPLEQIGRELGVQYVLEGSVRRDPEKVRISAQLILVKDQSHVWSQQYDREVTGMLALQGQIAREIADQIELTIGDRRRFESANGAPLSRETYEAYDLYLKGRYFWNKRTPQGFERAVQCFQQAIEKDAKYARGYAGLADSYALMSNYNIGPENEFMPKARAAALKALQLDEQLAEAHTSLALISENYDWDWEQAEKEFKRAIELDPNYATAHHWYAEHLAYRGRFEEAVSEIERARKLDPLSLIIAADDGAILYFSRQYDRAIERLRGTLDMDPDFPRARMIIYAYTESGRVAEALAEIDKWRKNDATPYTWAVEAYVYGRSGKPKEAQEALARLEESVRKAPQESTVMYVIAYSGMEQKDQAFNQLNKAVKVHSSVLMSLKVDPIYDPLRSDPRFEEILGRVGLAR